MKKLIATILMLLLGFPAHLTAAAGEAPPPETPATEAASNPDAAGSGRNIRFQFEGMPYADVIERFAQMANKPVITDVSIEGTLTFNDPQAYTYEEALDTLNVILSMKSVMLVETGRYLRLVPFKEIPQMPLPVFRGLDQTGDARPGEIVTVVMTLQHMDPEEIAKATASMLSSAGSIAPLSRGKGLIITDRLSNIRRIRDLIAEVDTDSPVERQMRTYTLLTSSGAVVADLINRTFGEATAPRRTRYNEQNRRLDVLPPDPNDYITAVFEEASRTLVLFGPRERVTLAEDLVTRFEEQDGARGGEIKIFYPQSISAGELARIIREAIPAVAAPNERAQTAVTKARLIIDEPTNRLIVTAPVSGQLEAIESLIRQVDSGSGPGGAIGAVDPVVSEALATRVFRLRNANPATVARAITETITRRGPGPAVRVSPEPSSRSLVVTGITSDVELAAELVNQMDEDSRMPGQQLTRFIELADAAEVRRLAPLVQDLYRSQMSDGVNTPHARILPDPDAIRLIVTASAEHMERIEGIVAQLRADRATPQPRQLRVIHLQHVRIEQAMGSITNLVAEKMNDPRFNGVPRPLLLPDSSNNRLLVTASDAQIGEVEAVVAAIDIAPARARREMTLVPLRSQTAGSMIPMLTKLLEQEVDSGSALAPRVMPDNTGRQLIVLALPEDLNKILRMVQQLDGGGAGQAGDETRIIRLQTAVAAELAGLIEKSLNSPIERVKVVVDPRSNSLVLTGGRAAVEMAADLIEQLDTPASLERREMRIIELESADASVLAPLVNNLFAEMLRDARGPTYASSTRIVAESGSNRIIITGIGSEIAQLVELIGRLDNAPGQAGGSRIFHLQHASAVKLAPVVNEAMTRIENRVRVNRVTVTADASSNTLIVSGSRADLQDAAVIIEKLDSEGRGEERALRIVAVSSEQPAQLAALVRQIVVAKHHDRVSVGDVTINAEPAGRRLVILAPAGLLDEIEGLIAEMEQGTAAGREVRILRLENSSAASAASVIQQVVFRRFLNEPIRNRPSVSAAPDDRTLIVEAPEGIMGEVEEMMGTLIQTLDSSERPGSGSLQTVHLRQGEADVIAAAVNRALASRGPQSPARRISVTAVSSSNSLLLDGPSDAMPEVLEIIRELDGESTGGDVEVRIYKLENGNVREVSAILRQLLQGAGRQRGRAAGAVQATVAVDERLGSLIISGAAPHFSLVEQVLPTLDQVPERPDRMIHVVWLNSAKAGTVAARVQAMFDGRPSAERPMIEADLFSNSITIVGKRADIPEIEELIQQLDESARDSSVQVRMLPIDRIPVEQMARMLQTMYGQMNRGELRIEDRLPPLQRESRAPEEPAVNPDAPEEVQEAESPDETAEAPAPLVVIAVNKDANTLLLSGPAAELDYLEGLVFELSFSFVTGDAEFRQFRLKEADPVVVARTLTELFRPEQVRQAPREGEREGRVVTPPPRVGVVAESRTRSVIIRARPTDFVLLESLIAQLDAEGVSAQLDFRIIPIENANPEKLLPLVNQMIAQLGEVRPGEPVSVTAAPRERALLAVARDSVLNQIEELARALDVPSPFAEAEIVMVPLRKTSAAQLASVLQAMLQPSAAGQVTPEARELQEHVRRLKIHSESGEPILLDLTRPIKIMADPQQGANRLFLSSTAENVRALAAVVELMDETSIAGFDQVRFFALEHADAAAVQRLVTEMHAGPRAALFRTEDRPTVIVDPRTNVLIVNGNAASIELVETLLARLDTATPVQVRDIRILALENADATAVASALQRMMDARVKQRSALGRQDAESLMVLIIGDPRTNSLLIGGSRESYDLVEALARELDLAGPALSGRIRLIPLEHADARALSATLTTLFNQRYQAARTPDAQRERPIILADPRTNSLLVAAGIEDNRALDELLAELDRQPAHPSVQLTVIGLRHNDAARVAAAIQTIFAARAQSLAAPGAPVQPQDRVNVQPDPLTNSLIISATPDNIELVRELLKQLDAPGMVDAENIRIYRLQNATASHLAIVLEQFFRAKRAAETAVRPAERSIPVTITPDDRTGTLLITAGAEDFASIEKLIEQLDTGDVVSRTTFRVFQLQQTTAAKLQATLQRLFVNRPPRAPGQPADPINVVADSMINTLIVSASAEDMIMVANLIERLDVEPTENGIEVQVLPLAKADARRIAETIQNLYRDGATVSPVIVNVDERLNAVLVSAGEADLRRIVDLVQRLDTDIVAKVAELRVFPLKNARAQELATILTAVLNTRLEALAEQSPIRQSLLQFITRTPEGQELIASALKESVLIIPDPRMNSLVVTGPADCMHLIEKIVARLDSTTPQIAKIKVFNLRNADARQMAEVLTSVFRLTQAPGAEAIPRSIQYTLVRRSDAEGVGDDAASATIGTAEQHALTVTVDLRTNSLLIGGADHYVSLASEIIEELDSSPAQERISRVYRLRNAQAIDVETAITSFLDQDRQRIISVIPAEAMGTVQQLLEREVAIVAEPVSNTLLLSASPRYFDQIQSLIEEVDQPQPQVLIQVLLAEVTLDVARDLGVEWTYTTASGNSQISTGTDFGVLRDLQTFGGFSSAVTGSDYSFLLRALQSEGRLEVLSRPQILTADNQPAAINIGQQVPVITQSRMNDRIDAIISQFEYRAVGVQLSVTPRISPDGFVKMDVATTNSALSQATIEVSPGVRIPIINERLATTTVSVQSGQSIIIGGLISTSDDVLTRKTPILGDIPYLGALFRSTTALKDRKELLIILTPQVLVNVNRNGAVRDAADWSRDELGRSGVKYEPSDSNGLKQRLLEPFFNEPDTGVPAPESED